MAGTIGKVLFTRWTRTSFGRELNWHGRLLARTLTGSTAGPSRLPEDIITSNGHKLSTQALTEYGITEKAEIQALAGQIDKLVCGLIDVPNQSGSQIMVRELVAGLGKLLLKNYEPAGNNVGDFKKALNAGEGKSLVWASYDDAKEIAVRLSKITGEEWDVQSEPEWEAAKRSLSGKNWTSTRTDHEEYSPAKVFRHLGNVSRGSYHPVGRCDNDAVRLVRTKK